MPETTPFESPESKQPEITSPPNKEVFQATSDELRQLSEDIKINQIPTTPSLYNHEKTTLKETDTIDSILNEIFSGLSIKIPPTAINRINLALTQSNLDINAVRTGQNATAWQLENGVLIFLDQNNEKTSSFNLLPWTELSESTGLREIIEEKTHTYQLGKYREMLPSERPSPDTPPQYLEGSVDATRHAVNVKTDQWYKDKADAAKTLMTLINNFPSKFEPATLQLLQNKLPHINDLALQTDFAPQSFINNFEKNKLTDDIYGTNGIYNVILAFQRVMDSLPANGDLREQNVIIALKIGKNVNKAEERYTKWLRLKDDSEDNPEPPPPQPPEDDENDPFKPDEIPEELEKLENNKYKTSRNAEMLSKKSITGLTSTMTAKSFEYGGNTYDMLYVIDKANPKNPQYYVAFDKNDPFTVLIGSMDYDFGILSSSAKPGTILHTITLDKTNRTATQTSLSDILNKLP